MKIYVINLAAQPKRWNFMKKQLEQIRIQNFERFPAVVGKTLPQKFTKKISDSFAQWCSIGKTLTLSEIGCTFSHLSIYRKMIQENIPIACILEDDVTLKQNFKESLIKAEEFAKVNHKGIILLSSVYNNDNEPISISSIKGETAACGYIVTLAAAKKLLTLNLPIKSPCDHWGLWLKLGVPLYKSIPRALIHENRAIFGSMMDNELKQSTENIIVKKLKRIIGKSIFSFLCFFYTKKQYSELILQYWEAIRK